MIIGNTGDFLFTVPVQQTNLQVVCSDLHIKTVIHTLIIQVLVRVQFVRLTVHFTRIRVHLFTHDIDQALGIQYPRWNLRPLQGSPDDFYLVLQLDDLCFRMFLSGYTAGDKDTVVTQSQG